DDVPQVRRRRRGRVAPLARPGAAHRAAEARRRHGRGGAPVPERARVSALAAGRGYAWRAPALHADDRGAVRPRHRRVPGRASSEDPLLERIQARRPLVGRAAALLALAVPVGVYYGVVGDLPRASLWWEVGWLSLAVIPAVCAFPLVLLPLARLPVA